MWGRRFSNVPIFRPWNPRGRFGWGLVWWARWGNVLARLEWINSQFNWWRIGWSSESKLESLDSVFILGGCLPFRDNFGFTKGGIMGRTESIFVVRLSRRTIFRWYRKWRSDDSCFVVSDKNEWGEEEKKKKASFNPIRLQQNGGKNAIRRRTIVIGDVREWVGVRRISILGFRDRRRRIWWLGGRGVIKRANIKLILVWRNRPDSRSISLLIQNRNMLNNLNGRNHFFKTYWRSWPASISESSESER